MANFKVKVITPEREVYNGDASKLTVRTTTGDVCILDRHIPYVAPLGIGKMTINIDGDKKVGASSGGFISVTKELVSVLATEFEWKSEINIEENKKILENSNKELLVLNDVTKKPLLEARVKITENKIKIANS